MGAFDWMNECKIAHLCQRVFMQYEKLQEMLGNFVLSKNQDYVDARDKTPLQSGDEIAIIPPISGG